MAWEALEQFLIQSFQAMYREGWDDTMKYKQKKNRTKQKRDTSH
jgi:hypothetical protein